MSAIHPVNAAKPAGKPVLPGMPSLVRGAEAALFTEAAISQAACAFPTPPASLMMHLWAELAAEGKRNLWGESIQFLAAESDHSAATACEGFALAGGRVTGFTSGQGLALMKEVLHVISGKRLPVVLHVGARALTSQGPSYFCGHDDVMGVLDCGWGILFARNAQEVADFALIARRAAEYAETPFFVVQDGYFTTHSWERILAPDAEMMTSFAGAPSERIRAVFTPHRPLVSGPAVDEPSYMRGRVAQRFFYDRVGPALRAAMQEFAVATGREYGLVRGYRMEDAEFAFLGLGSMMETAELAVDRLREEGVRAGCVSLYALRPFPSSELIEAFAKCLAVCVLERTDAPLADSNPVTRELKAALVDALADVAAGEAGGSSRLSPETLPEVFSGVAGLGGMEVRPAHFLAAYQNMASHGWRTFVVGVKHREALPEVGEPDVLEGKAYTLRGCAVGGIGPEITTHLLAAAGADIFNLSVRATPGFGKERIGQPVEFEVSFSPERIKLHARRKQVDFLAALEAGALYREGALDGLREGGVLLIQTELLARQLVRSLPAPVKQRIRERGWRVWALPAAGIAAQASDRPELQTRLQGIALLGAFLRISPLAGQAGIPEEELFARIDALLARQFAGLGFLTVMELTDVAVRAYQQAAEISLREAGPELDMGASAGAPSQAPPLLLDGRFVSRDFCERVVTSYAKGRPGDVEADIFAARNLLPQASSIHKSYRTQAPEIPIFEPGRCTGCMECVTQCPDTAILARVVEPDALQAALASISDAAEREALRRNWFAVTEKYHEQFVKRGEQGGLFALFIDVDRCKGCGECVTACGVHAALRMGAKAELDLKAYDAGIRLFYELPDTPQRFLNEKSLADMMLTNRALLYTGGGVSCKGCGEGTALRMLTAATGFVYGADHLGLVAATGCLSEFGTTYPYNAFRVPFTSSLLENAAADAMGIRLRWDQQGYFRRRLWVLGDDEALYESGFQSLSRLLSSGMDIKIFLLDAQSFFDAPAQPPAVTPSGAGVRRERRKELAQIAMMHPGVYVAQTSIAHTNHFYRCVMEANDFPGPALVICFSSCVKEHDIPEDHAAIQAKLAVESRAFPILIYDPRKGEKVRQRLSLQGNPALHEDWYRNPKTGEPLDFIRYARTEGRFARHFDAQGAPDAWLMEMQEDRRANWRVLQELAGLL